MTADPALEPGSPIVPGRIARALRMASVAAGVSLALIYVACAVVRLRYPFDLEWIEGGMLDAARRAADGLPLFVRPSLAYVPFNYTPLYFYVAAPLLRVLGDGFLALRLVSFLSSLGVLAVIVTVVRRLSGDGLAATLAACLFAASYGLTDAWYDLARADSLYVFLLAAGFAWVVLDHSRVRAGLVAGAVFALAYFTKQSAILPVAAFAGYALVFRRGAGILAGATFAVLVVVGSLALDRASGGWYAFFIWKVPAGHHPEWARLPYFWIRYAGPLAVATLLGLGYLVWPARRAAPERADLAAACGALVLSAWAVGLYPGGAHNIAIPGVFAIALLFGMGYHAAREACRMAPAPARPRLELVLHAACLLQFVALGYDPRGVLPRHGDVAAGESLVRLLAREPGDVLVPFHPYVARAAGHAAHYHAMALGDVLAGGGRAVSEPLAREIQAALESGRYAAVVVDEGNRSMLDTNPGYGPERALFPDPAVLRTRSGSPTRPEFLHVLARSQPPPPGASR